MIDVVSVTKSYHGKTLFKDVSFSVQSGDLCCVVGASGSGKTTLLHIVAGIDEPDDGHVTIDDANVSLFESKACTDVWCNVLGMVFQEALLVPEFLVWENIAIKGFVRGMSRDYAYVRAVELAEYLDVVSLLDRPVSGLSGGEQQRIALARALFLSPRYLLADEPTSALDDRSTDQFLMLLNRVRVDHRVGICLVSHDPRVHTMAPQVLCLRDERLLKLR